MKVANDSSEEISCKRSHLQPLVLSHGWVNAMIRLYILCNCCGQQFLQWSGKAWKWHGLL